MSLKSSRLDVGAPLGAQGAADLAQGGLGAGRVQHGRDQVLVGAGRRDQGRQGGVDRPLIAPGAAARTQQNLVPPMLEAARAEATLGEICGALRSEWGAYTEPAAF